MGVGPLLERKDTVLAAETGSGKTLAYLLPLLTHILHEKHTHLWQDPPEAQPDLANSEPFSRRKSHRCAWVLCPSVDLCLQVQSVIRSLSSFTDPPLITTEISPAGFSRYAQRPDVLLGTPGSVLTTLTEMHKAMTEGILQGVGYVVVDEADLMLTGSYRSQIDRLFQMLYLSEREIAVQHLSLELGLSKEDFLALPRHQKRAGVDGGVPAMIEAGYSAATAQVLDPPPRPFWKRQFVLAGATIPSLGTKNVRDEIQKLFPSAQIISTANLHKTSSQLSYEWIQIESGQRMEALLEALQQDPSFQLGSRGKILVFTKDVSSVDATVEFLAEHGMPSIPYHKKLTSHYRTANLTRFRKEDGVVMVCTDGMSRGMDIDHVTHVIQAHFAPSAIAFVHRVGRTARAGRKGRVTSLCTDSDQDLAEAIRECLEDGRDVEGAFSRNRSFRKKMRRYGVFVPRGAVPASPPACDETGCLI